jgi:phage FluMu protein Com
MAIRFRCHRCNQLLGIATRKAGQEIECPKCGTLQTVPSEEAAAAAMAMRQFAVRQETEAATEVVVYEDDPTPIDTPRRPPGGEGKPSPPSAPAAFEPAGEPSENMVAYPRRTLYLHGLLFAVLAVVAFAAGYLTGRGDATLSLEQAHKEAVRERVLVDGRVVYDPGGGSLEGDDGAVVIALPDGKKPAETLSIQGLRPRDPAPAEADESVQAIEAIGGAYARVDASGMFSLVLPATGKYRLLIVSRQTERPADQRIDELDLDQIREYFYRGSDLVGWHKYRWSPEELHSGGDSITQDFGTSGQ